MWRDAQRTLGQQASPPAGLRRCDQGGWRRAQNSSMFKPRPTEPAGPTFTNQLTKESSALLEAAGWGRPLPSVAWVQSVQAQALVPALSLEHLRWVPLEPQSRQRITSNQLKQTSRSRSDGRFLGPRQPPPPVRTQSWRSERARGCRGIPQHHSVCTPPGGQNRHPPPTPTTHLWRKETLRCSVAACFCCCEEAVPLWDEDSHAEHLRLEALLVVTQSTSEEKEAGAVGLMLAETFNTHIYPHGKAKNTLKGKISKIQKL